MNRLTLFIPLSLGTESLDGFSLRFEIEGYYDDEGRFAFDPSTGELDHSKALFQSLWVRRQKEMTALIDRIAEDERDSVNLTRVDFEYDRLAEIRERERANNDARNV